MHPSVFCRPIYNWKDMETSIDGLTDKKDMRYTHAHIHNTMKYYSAIKKKEILPSATTWMDREGFMLN